MCDSRYERVALGRLLICHWQGRVFPCWGFILVNTLSAHSRGVLSLVLIDTHEVVGIKQGTLG